MSTRYPLFRLPLTGNCAANGERNGGHGQWWDEQRNSMTLSLLTNLSSLCNLMTVGFEFRDPVCRVVLCNAELLRYINKLLHSHTGPAPDAWFGGGIAFHCGTLLGALPVNWTGSVRPLRCWSQWSSYTYSCREVYPNNIMHDYTWHAIFKKSSSAMKASINRKPMVHSCTMTGLGCTIRCYTRSIFKIQGSHMNCYAPKETSKTSLILCRNVWHPF